MNKLSIPYHLLIPAIISGVLLLLTFLTQRRFFEKRKILWLALLTFFSSYTLITAFSVYDTIDVELSASKFDLNKNGLYEETELTEEAKKALAKISNDTGRNFSIITGFIFTLILSLFVFISGALLKTAIAKLKK